VFGIFGRLLSAYFGRKKPDHFESEAGELRSCMFCKRISLLFGFALVAIGILTFYYNGQQFWLSALLLGLLGVGSFWVSFNSMRLDDTLRWDVSGVEGVTANKRERLFIEWGEISRVKISEYDGLWSLQSQDGQWLYWSYLHSGHSYFRDILKEKLNPEIIEE